MTRAKTKAACSSVPLDPLVGWLWGLMWRRWMTDCNGNRLTVVRVKGWRTAVVESKTEPRKTMTPCFTVFGLRFD